MNSLSGPLTVSFCLLLVASVSSPETLAAAPEVQGLRFDSATRLEWDGEPGVLG